MNTTPREIVLATGNPHKVEEMRAIFASLSPPGGIRLIGLGDLDGGTALSDESSSRGAIVEPAETGSTFEQNAAIKASSYTRQTGRWCLADDSGLEIDALGGRPGVISSHYCTDGRETGMTRPQRDRANNERVLRELAGVEFERRTARFVCVMCLASPTGEIIELTRGTFEGRIGLPASPPPPASRAANPTNAAIGTDARLVPRGEHGFGYDPIFLVAPAFDRTGAELPPEEKNRLSHRASAARLMAERLRAGL